MTKVVYNACYGGFGVSEAGMRRYCELKGIPCWIVPDAKMASLGLFTCWTVAPDQRPRELDWRAASIEERQAYNQAYRAATLDCRRDVSRHDTVFVQVVEELGEAASAPLAKLRIEEIPDGTPYRIDEYDGYESVHTADSYDWIAP